VLRESNKKKPLSKQVESLIMPYKEIQKLTTKVNDDIENGRPVTYRLTKCTKKDNMQKKYEYMLNHWDGFVEDFATLKLEDTETNFMAYTTFMQHITKMKKIAVHYTLFIWEKPQTEDGGKEKHHPSLEEIRTFFSGYKNIDKRMDDVVKHKGFKAAGLWFPQAPPKDQNDDEGDETTNTQNNSTTNTQNNSTTNTRNGDQLVRAENEATKAQNEATTAQNEAEEAAKKAAKCQRRSRARHSTGKRSQK
jgi:hypothetical protein